VSQQTWNTYSDADLAVNKVYATIALPDQYVIDSGTPGGIFVRLKDTYGMVIASSKTFFADAVSAQAFIDGLVAAFKPSCDAEGLFLVEHLLLRPRFTVNAVAPATPESLYEPLQVCLAKDCAFCGEEDPYSFRASVLLPYWPVRFQDMDFRRFFETILREEAPAHVSLKICWINYTSMQRFQAIYQEWLLALQAYETDLLPDDQSKQDAFRLANNKMVEFLAQVHSEYPEARLHDCDTGITNPVTLGSTVLGSY
jgi:hypothetical protein